MMRIIGVGNRWVQGDCSGLEVCDRLRTMPLPDDVEVIDGGLCGLDLLRFVDGADSVVFVDCMIGGAPDAELTVLDREAAAACSDDAGFHHGAGLPYLLRLLPNVVEGTLPHVQVVGVPPRSDASTLERAAALCLELLAEDRA